MLILFLPSPGLPFLLVVGKEIPGYIKTRYEAPWLGFYSLFTVVPVEDHSLLLLPELILVPHRITDNLLLYRAL